LSVSAGEAVPLSAFLRPELPDAALCGLPGEVTRELAAGSEADPAALLLTFLAMFGNAAGPQPHAVFGGAPQPGRLFLLVVGEAASGRKGTAHQAVEALFRDADPLWSANRIFGGLQSAEAMVEHVADQRSDDCRLLVVETEFDRLVETMARTGTLAAQLRNAFDGRVLAVTRRDRGRSLTASNAHVSLIGHIVPGELLRHHRRLRQAGGLESRFLYAYVNRQAGDVSPFGAAGPSAPLAAKVGRALERSRSAVLDRADPVTRRLCLLRGVQPCTQLDVSGDVRDAWPDVRRRLTRSDHDLGAMFQRAETHVIRLAVIYSLADSSHVVDMTHVDAALAVWSYCARSAEVIFGIPVGGLPPARNPKQVAKVVDALHRAYPGWLARGEIGHQVLKGNVPAAQIEAILTYVQDDLKMLERREIKTAGRPREEYRLVGPFSR
jgi:Protein of unknown function (DUF3987)